jgi:hypothetical protein
LTAGIEHHVSEELHGLVLTDDVIERARAILFRV